MNNRVHQGHLARKRFGQNFLNDQFVIDSIVAAINPQKGQAMVEIGLGLAALTEPVGERLDELTVIELDRDLAARLKTHLPDGQATGPLGPVSPSGSGVVWSDWC